MKRLTFILAFLMLFFGFGRAQSTPEAFLGLLPKSPTIDCNTESTRQNEASSAFRSQVNDVREKLTQAIRIENKKNKNQQLSKNLKAQAAAQSGLSEEELKTASDKKTAQSEKDRLVSKSVQSQTGFSMEEMQQVKKMSKADRQKWAMENFGKVTQKEQQKSEATEPYRATNGSMAKLAQEQQGIAESLQHYLNRLNEIKKALENTADEQRAVLKNKIAEIEKKYKNVNDGEGGTEEDAKKLREKNRLIRDAKIKFCSKLTPLNIDYIVNYESILKENILPDLKRQEDINYQIQKMSVEKAEKSSFDRLRAVEEYAVALSKAYDYYMSVDKIE